MRVNSLLFGFRKPTSVNKLFAIFISTVFAMDGIQLTITSEQLDV